MPQNNLPNGDAEHAGATKLNGAPPVSTLTVCLLDDDPSVLKSTGRLLSSGGWEIQSFTDPHAFLRHSEIHQPRVAIIDIRMPEMDGFEVQKRLSTISPRTEVIVLTSMDDPAVRSQAIGAGAAAFFVKPPVDHELLGAIETAAKQSERR
jgi:two-component system response regulator FixJ